MAVVADRMLFIAQHNQIKTVIPHGQLYWVISEPEHQAFSKGQKHFPGLPNLPMDILLLIESWSIVEAFT